MSDDRALRRSPYLVTYWESGTIWIYNYSRRSEHRGSPTRVALLDAASRWTTRDALCAAVASDTEDVGRIVDELVAGGLLEALDEPRSDSDRALEGWERWNPAAGFFHAVTQSAIRSAPADMAAPHGDAPVLTLHDFPNPLKSYEDGPRIELPRPRVQGELPAVLQARRTWRQFGDQKLTLAETSALLGYTFGVQRWLELNPDRWVALKTSPAGGARHSIEAYLLAFAIDGIDDGTYHYCPDAHALTLLSSPTARELLRAAIPGQPGFHDPAACVVMTSVFARMQWKYPSPHAYRVVLLDAGHLSQTFMLVATALGLAPFCTASVNAELLERHLRIDGVRESAMLILGVGSRPEGKEWAPMHDHSEPPRTRPPGWASRP